MWKLLWVNELLFIMQSGATVLYVCISLKPSEGNSVFQPICNVWVTLWNFLSLHGLHKDFRKITSLCNEGSKEKNARKLKRYFSIKPGRIFVPLICLILFWTLCIHNVLCNDLHNLLKCVYKHNSVDGNLPPDNFFFLVPRSCFRRNKK